MNLCFAFLLPKEIEKFAAKHALKQAKKFPNFFVVDNQRLFLHITIVAFYTSKSKLKEIKSLSAGFINKVKPLSLALRGYWDADKNGSLGISIKLSLELIGLRKDLVSFVHGNGLGKSKTKKSYSPHITLTWFLKQEQAANLVYMGGKFKKQFTVNTLALCASDKFGQVHKKGKNFRIIKKFKLKG